jgi:predicted amino acid-binding ACT domain protein
MIMKNSPKLEDIAVRGITSNKKESKITICSVPDQPGIAAQLFAAISATGANVDIIVQNVSHSKQTDISFTVPKTDLGKAIKATEAIGKKIGAGEILEDKNIARVSMVGSGMRSPSGIAAKMFKTEMLTEKNASGYLAVANFQMRKERFKFEREKFSETTKGLIQKGLDALLAEIQGNPKAMALFKQLQEVVAKA